MATDETSMKDIDIKSITNVAADVEQYLIDFLDSRPLPNNLREACKYALLGGGKRLRPVLVIQSALAVGGSLQNALPPAAAIEMIHAFSLVHDDLPAMDDDDLRRGRPTLHKHTDEAMAILAGDALMGLAFELITTKIADSTLATRIVAELATGNNNMIAGQIYDTLPDFEDGVESLERLVTIHKNKTGALLRASCRMGAMTAGANDKQINDLTQYADAIGLMFQVVDDVLDVTQTTEQLGKTAGKDVEQDKMTYPALMGLDKSRDEIERLHAESIQALAGFGESADALRHLSDYMAVRQH
ncbi:Farnesyl diphosphate synthase [Poriferisphaera corsica]|uniref:Farnesyl diphosphate synthase n=1 Tax=Poriferisphaera corsica TaxID=2528020 RepID=A0A517YR18_9BACT|nr:farnesyl diphosphate synthase [Poriferisphaera corsica]QDU32668.1 Farnesyl diphosphate synthase [Poriferisphaera corsica]